MTAIQNQANANEENARANRVEENLTKENLKINQKKADTEEKRRKDDKTYRTKSLALEQDKLKQQKNLALINAIGSAAGGLGSALGTGIATAAMFNDGFWYVASEEIAKSIASMPINDPVGTMYNAGNFGSPDEPYATSIFDGSHMGISKPSSLVAYYIPTLGNMTGTGTINPNDKVNEMADFLWSLINETNGRNSSYESSDLMMYQIGMASGIAILGFIQKAYSIADKHSGENDTLPYAILADMGFDPDDIIRHRYDIHNALCEFKNFLLGYQLIPNFYIADRWYYMARTILSDKTKSGDTQLYHFCPVMFPMVDVTTEKTSIRYYPWMISDTNEFNGRMAHTADDIYDLINSFKATFVRKQDVKIMNSDIKKYYGESAGSDWTPTKELGFDMPVMVTADPVSIAQFRNIHVYPVSSYNPSEYNITQSKQGNRLFCSLPQNGAALQGQTFPGRNAIIDAPPEIKLTPVNIVEMARLATLAPVGPTAYTPFTEIVVKLWMTEDSLVISGDQEAVVTEIQNMNRRDCTYYYANTLKFNDIDTNSNGFESINRLFNALTIPHAFQHAPRSMISITGVSTGDEYAGLEFSTFDWDNYTVLDANRVNIINQRVIRRLLGAGDKQ